MKSIMIIFLIVLCLSISACQDLVDEARNGVPIGDTPNLNIRTITVWADFDLDSCCSRVSQKRGLMTLPHRLFVRDLPDDTEHRYLQVEVLDYDRALQIASVCYESTRGDKEFRYSHTLLQYGDCHDDVAWTKDLSTLNFRVEKSDTIIVTGYGDFSGVREQFDFNISLLE